MLDVKEKWVYVYEKVVLVVKMTMQSELRLSLELPGLHSLIHWPGIVCSVFHPGETLLCTGIFKL